MLGTFGRHALKRLFAVALFLTGMPGLASAADVAAPDVFVHPDPNAGWYFGARAIVGASQEDTSFRTLPAGATGGEDNAYDPQENFGAGVMVGYGFSAWNVPLRAELSGSWMYRHDADALALGPPDTNYRNNLEIWDARVSLLADVLQFGWGRFYVGGGLGGALLNSDVTLEETGETADNSEWKFSPSAQAGLVFDDLVLGAGLELSYRFRWFGDTESGTFSDGAQLQYENAHIHEVMLGVVVPIGR
jgi:opacity protein-like surface antigen